MVRIVFAVMVLFFARNVGAQGLVDEAGALRGLDGLYVIGGDVSPVLASSGFDKEQTIKRVSARLREGGVRVLDEVSWLMAEAAPVLFIEIQDEDNIYSVRLEVLLLVHPLSDPSQTSYAVIWGEGRAGRVTDNVNEDLSRDIDVLASILIRDYVANQ